ncbi:MAG: hypothetical protein HXL38_002370 [Candidatus Saccharimonas sp.]|nr:MAG: hypothetical protein HXL38_002370 [Candidatus Saccharimonas sp.]
MISKEKWAEIKLDWKRYSGEYIALIFCSLLFLIAIWFFIFSPIIEGVHREELASLKTKILQKIVNNSATLEFSNENEAKKAEVNLKEISKRDKIYFESVKIHKNGENFEIKINFKSAK